MSEAPAPPLWSHDFLLFFIARSMARLGDMMLPVGLAAGLIQHGHGAGPIGLAMASFSACFAGFVIFGGVISDRCDTRDLMVGADLVRLVTQALMAAMFFAEQVVVWQVCVLGAVNGVCAALFQPGVASTLTSIATDVQGANGIIRTAESLMTIAGPALAGLLVGVTTAGGVFTVDAVTYLISGMCLLGIRSKSPGKRENLESFRTSLREGWRGFRARRWLWNVIVIWMIVMLTAYGPTTPLTTTQVISTHGEKVFGVVGAIGGLGMAVGGLLAMRIRPKYPLRAGAAGLLLYLVQPVAVGLGSPVPLIAAGFALTGSVMAFWGVMWATTVQTQVPGAILNRVHAIEVAGSLAMMPIGQALAGPAATLFGSGTVLLVNGAAALAGALALLSAPAVRGLRRGEPPSVEPRSQVRLGGEKS